MAFFNSGTFWFIEGILAVVVFLAFRAWMEDRGVRLTWWKWILVGLWVLLAGATIAFVGTSLGERETTAAFRGGILFGLVTVVSAVGLWRLLHIGREKPE